MPKPVHANKGSHADHSAGPIRYLDKESLHKPLDLPQRNYRFVFLFMGIAVVIGIFMFSNYYNSVVIGAQNQAKQVSETINRGVTLDLPRLSDYIEMSNDEIRASFNQSHYTIYDNSSSADTAAGGMDLYKLPSDVTLADAAVSYSQGIEKLSATSAARLLTGSWRFLTNRSNGIEMKVRYADFNATTADTALANARATEGFDTATAGSVGQDTVGNTTQSGTMNIDGTVYYWTISTCSLSNVYSNDGLPASAQYVGIRLATASA